MMSFIIIAFSSSFIPLSFGFPQTFFGKTFFVFFVFLCYISFIVFSSCFQCAMHFLQFKSVFPRWALCIFIQLHPSFILNKLFWENIRICIDIHRASYIMHSLQFDSACCSSLLHFHPSTFILFPLVYKCILIGHLNINFYLLIHFEDEYSFGNRTYLHHRESYEIFFRRRLYEIYHGGLRASLLLSTKRTD